jgi:hypothetical protein
VEGNEAEKYLDLLEREMIVHANTQTSDPHAIKKLLEGDTVALYAAVDLWTTYVENNPVSKTVRLIRELGWPIGKASKVVMLGRGKSLLELLSGKKLMRFITLVMAAHKAVMVQAHAEREAEETWFEWFRYCILQFFIAHPFLSAAAKFASAIFAIMCIAYFLTVVFTATLNALEHLLECLVAAGKRCYRRTKRLYIPNPVLRNPKTEVDVKTFALVEKVSIYKGPDGNFYRFSEESKLMELEQHHHKSAESVHPGSTITRAKSMDYAVAKVYANGAYQGMCVRHQDYLVSAAHVLKHMNSTTEVTLVSARGVSTFDGAIVLNAPFNDIAVIRITSHTVWSDLQMRSAVSVPATAIPQYCRVYGSKAGDKQSDVWESDGNGALNMGTYYHRISTEQGFSGTPLITSRSDAKETKVIAIHQCGGYPPLTNEAYPFDNIVRWLKHPLMSRKVKENSPEYFRKFMALHADEVRNKIVAKDYVYDQNTSDYFVMINGKYRWFSGDEFDELMDADFNLQQEDNRQQEKEDAEKEDREFEEKYARQHSENPFESSGVVPPASTDKQAPVALTKSQLRRKRRRERDANQVVADSQPREEKKQESSGEIPGKVPIEPRSWFELASPIAPLRAGATKNKYVESLDVNKHYPEFARKVEYKFPTSDLEDEIRSFNFQSDKFNLTPPPSTPALNAALNDCEEIFRGHEFEIPLDAFSDVHIERAIALCDMSKTPGAVYMREGLTSNQQVLDKLGKAGLIDEVRKRLQSYEACTPEQARYAAAPLRAFRKYEGHNPKKVATNRWRLIYGVDFIDLIVDRMLWTEYTAKANNNFINTPSKIGYAMLKGGANKLIKRAQKVSDKWDSFDAAFFDMTVPGWGNDATHALRKRKCLNATPKWTKIADNRQISLNYGTIAFSNGTVIKKLIAGLRVSGGLLTLDENSQFVTMLRVLYEIDNKATLRADQMIAMGDDSVQADIDDREKFVAWLAKKGIVFTIEAETGTFDKQNFCSADYLLLEDGTYVHVPRNWDKTTFALCHPKNMVAIGDTLGSLCLEYAYHPAFHVLHQLLRQHAPEKWHSADYYKSYHSDLERA